ncbi:hypothetical protein Dimus_036916, partial [Dionaea muscipula]
MKGEEEAMRSKSAASCDRRSLLARSGLRWSCFPRLLVECQPAAVARSPPQRSSSPVMVFSAVESLLCVDYELNRYDWICKILLLQLS